MAETYDLGSLYQQAMQPLPEAVTAYAQPAAADYQSTDFYAPTFDFVYQTFTPQGQTQIARDPYASDVSGYSFDPTSGKMAFTGGAPAPQISSVLGAPAPQARPYDVGALDVGGATADQQPTSQKSILDQIFGKTDIGKLLTGGLGAILGYTQQQKAAEQAAAARAEYEAAAKKAAEDYRTLGLPLTTAGGTQLSQVLGGTLPTAQLQQYQAGQARLAQEAARTGGVGAIQTAAGEQRLYSQALADAQTMALALLGPGNALVSNAISTELSGTQGGIGLELQLSEMANQASANMYKSIAYAVGYGGGPQQQPQQQPQRSIYG